MLCNVGPRPLLLCALELWNHWLPGQVHQHGCRTSWVKRTKSCHSENNPLYFQCGDWDNTIKKVGFELDYKMKDLPIYGFWSRVWKRCQFRFVKLDYIPVYSLEQMVETFEREVICDFPQIFVSFSLSFWYTLYDLVQKIVHFPCLLLDTMSTWYWSLGDTKSKNDATRVCIILVTRCHYG